MADDLGSGFRRLAKVAQVLLIMACLVASREASGGAALEACIKEQGEA
ncbi:MAG: hypothetical protein ACLQVL_36650 [Terriglobia bacterium]